MSLNAEDSEDYDEPFQSQYCNTSVLWDICSVIKRVSLAAVGICHSVWSLQNSLSLGFASCHSWEGLHPMLIRMFFLLCFFLIFHCPLLIELQNLYIIHHSYHLHHTLVSNSKKNRGKDFISKFGKQDADRKNFLLTVYATDETTELS